MQLYHTSNSKIKIMSLLMQFSYVKKGTSKPQVFTVPPVNTELLTKSDFQTLDTMAVHVSRAFQQASCSYQSIATHPPLSFDYRQEFSTYLPPISNQGTCGACWAFSTCSTLAARFAIMRNQRVVPLSASYLLFCARPRHISIENPDENQTLGCYGGNLAASFWFTELNGVVAESCVPYNLEDWISDKSVVEKRRIQIGDTGETERLSCAPQTCPSKKGLPWLYRSTVCYIVAGTTASGGSEENIRADIYYHGPVSTGYEVRQDFVEYWKALLEGTLHGKELVYVPKPADDKDNPVVGGHAVMIVGYGTVGGVDYWTIANTWGKLNPDATLSQYGLNGYFLMQRGANAAGIEGNVVASLPAIDPAFITSRGHSYTGDELKLCNFNAFDINSSTLQAMDLLQYVPYLHGVINPYLFSYPENAPPTQLDQFGQCPEDRPVRCEIVGDCVTAGIYCGSHKPSTGPPTTWLLPAGHLAAAREFSNYTQALSEEDQLKLSARSTRKGSHFVSQLQPTSGMSSGFAQLPSMSATRTNTSTFTHQQKSAFYSILSVIVVLLFILCTLRIRAK